MQKSIAKYCALATVVAALTSPISAYALDGKGGSPDCAAKGNQATTAQNCENSKSQGGGGASGSTTGN